MRLGRLSELVNLMHPLGAELVGEDIAVGPDVVIDNRVATAGCLFVALPGARVDGHDFAGAAVEAGAVAVMGTRLTEAAVPHILVADTVEGLSALARGLVRQARATGLISVGITGSSGKTSTKDLAAQVLEAHGPTIAPQGSQNNEIGVPLTACRIAEDTRFLVSEMGSRGQGHISWLTSLVGLDVAAVINVGTAHVGEFGGVEATAKAKAEIVADLGPKGWAVLNGDDPHCLAMAAATTAQLAWFGEGELPPAPLRVKAVDIASNELLQCSFTLQLEREARQECAEVKLQLVGRHQVSNALAAATIGLVAGMSIDDVAAALSGAEPRSQWRMELIRGTQGRLVLNDAYNANPDSMAAALRSLAELISHQRASYPAARAIAVVGDMLELGEVATRCHEQVGELAAELGIDDILAVGDHGCDVVRAATAKGAKARMVSRDEAAAVELSPGDILLVKGSRGIGLEAVAQAVTSRIEGGLR